MTTIHRLYVPFRRALILFAAAAGLIGLAEPAPAYLPFDSTTCNPGQKWDVSRPVKVRFLADSVTDYLNSRGANLIDLDRMNRDVKAVIDLYNAIPGSRLVLEQDTGITGVTSDLPAAEDKNLGSQTIVIGFTKAGLGPKNTAEADTSFPSNDDCTRTRAHIRISKNFYWIFGPPDSTEVDGRAFTTNLQPGPGPSGSPPRTFLGILTHEMGHAAGLQHPYAQYAVMAQNFRTWFRGKDEVLHTQLLPDDTAGLVALYGRSGFKPPLDISVTNSWFEVGVRSDPHRLQHTERGGERGGEGAWRREAGLGRPVGHVRQR